MIKRLIVLIGFLMSVTSCASGDSTAAGETLIESITQMAANASNVSGSATVDVEIDDAAELNQETQETETTDPVTSVPPTRKPTIPPEINPLTGLLVENPVILHRRPILVKVENLPRRSRPQWGLSLADIVYEYHTEEGSTRFGALFYSQNAEKVGPVRSGRIFDIQLIQMYKSIFIFGGAFSTVMEEFGNYDFGDRFVIEGPYTDPALFRYEPDGRNYLLANLYEMDAVIGFYGIDNTLPDLEGMTFDETQPVNGLDADKIFVRFSSAIYNRWDYEPESGRYFRYSDADNAYSSSDEVYEQLFDRLTGEPIAADNLVILMVKNVPFAPNIYDILLSGQGEAFIARDGQIFDVLWSRENPEDILSLVREDGTPFPFKPGQTWFEVLSDPTNVEKQGDSWRFTFRMPELWDDGS
ncbi:MAG: DUF3048 domain-containing protein [Anaerolineaceae bacterium]|nr:DUF3048 domain-containing protein [Anaerolineaceae bacterium]